MPATITDWLPDGGRNWTEQLALLAAIPPLFRLQLGPKVNSPPPELKKSTVPVGVVAGRPLSLTVAMQVSLAAATMKLQTTVVPVRPGGVAVGVWKQCQLKASFGSGASARIGR